MANSHDLRRIIEINGDEPDRVLRAVILSSQNNILAADILHKRYGIHVTNSALNYHQKRLGIKTCKVPAHTYNSLAKKLNFVNKSKTVDTRRTANEN